MYSNSNPTFSRAADSLTNFPSPIDTSSLQHHQTLCDSQLNSEASYNNNAGGNYNSCSSGCTSYMGSPSSMASYSDRLMQRSISSHSLQKNHGPHRNHNPFSSLFAELLDTDNGPVRRVYSAGDVQRVNGMQQYYHQSDSPLSTESSMIIEQMSRPASPYSPQEKKVRIERYKSKRNQRNYNKKIKYVCRKTLADNRPRIRGRFAKNDEIVMNPPIQWNHNSSNNGEELEDDEEEENWDNFFHSLLPTSNLPHDESQHSSSFGVHY